MGNRFRKFIESVVYAGLKPSASAKQAPQPDQGGQAAPPAKGWLDRFLAQSEPANPLYLTNQPLSIKLKRLAILAAPIMLCVAAIVAALILFDPRGHKKEDLSAAEMAARILPNFKTGDIQLNGNKKITVLDAHFDPQDGSLLGNMRNNTDRTLPEATVVFDLTDAGGSQLGAVTVTETNLAPGDTRKFHLAIDQKNAAFALVRDVVTP